MNLTRCPDIVFCALVIYGDLAQHIHPVTYDDLRDLCERHGGAPLFDPTLPRQRRAKCHDEQIIVSPFLTLAEYREVLPHELVHRLAETPRWAWLNAYIDGWRYDRETFLEAVACLVGIMFAAYATM